MLTHWEGEPVGIWERLWDVPRFEAWDSLGSTNDRVRELARSGAESFTVVIAEEQTAGRGRAGRVWSSPRGVGLWMSVLVAGDVVRPTRFATPDSAQTIAPLMPLVAGVAVCRAIESTVGGLLPELKWPNDVLCGGRKVAGVLCEASAGAAAVGIGVNVLSRGFPPALRESAVTLQQAVGRSVSRGPLAGAILSELRALLGLEADELSVRVRSEAARRDALEGCLIQVEGGVRGIARGIDRDGALRVEVVPSEREGWKRVTAGTVRVVPDGSRE